MTINFFNFFTVKFVGGAFVKHFKNRGFIPVGVKSYSFSENKLKNNDPGPQMTLVIERRII